jgi:predicted TIM-barrel fold metal-dependent hydrolase
LPLTHDVADSIEEMEQCATAGLKTVLLQGFPSGKAYPSKEDDPFWAAALDLKMPVSVHVDLDRSGERAAPLFKYPQESDELKKKLIRTCIPGA